MASRIETYLAHLDHLTGDVEPELLPIPTKGAAHEGVTVMAYRDLPAGHRTAFTYGLSLGSHSEWTDGHPELCISVRSDDKRWAAVIGYLAAGLRGDCPFAHGDTINFGRPVAEESAMTAFAMYLPAVVEADEVRFDVSPAGHAGHDIINLVGVYPIHDVERRYIHDHGFAAFWEIGWDRYDVRRDPAV